MDKLIDFFKNNPWGIIKGAALFSLAVLGAYFFFESRFASSSDISLMKMAVEYHEQKTNDQFKKFNESLVGIRADVNSLSIEFYDYMDQVDKWSLAIAVANKDMIMDQLWGLTLQRELLMEDGLSENRRERALIERRISILEKLLGDITRRLVGGEEYE